MAYVVLTRTYWLIDLLSETITPWEVRHQLSSKTGQASTEDCYKTTSELLVKESYIHSILDFLA